MKAAQPVREYLSGQPPLVLLIQELSKKKKFRQVVVQRGDLASRLERQGERGQVLVPFPQRSLR